MQTSNSSVDRVLPAVERAGERFTTLATAADPSVRVPASPEWNVRDVAAHLVTVTARYADGPRGRGAWVSSAPDLAAVNREQVNALATPTVPELSARLRSDLADLCAQIRGYGSKVPSFRDGRLHVNPPNRVPIDAHVSADPGPLLLVLYRRESQWRHIAAGRMVAWGRRPWLALTLTSRFHKP
jgi:Mycothiol maleylpyruvate isomerase N-terminal domain